MACYLGILDSERECAGCGHSLAPGLTGWADEIRPPMLRPVCSTCLRGLDRRLADLLPTSGALFDLHQAAEDLPC
ncbi:MAG: hypothetical protein GY719_25640 [bacterium]|nr:hypothetical protein [bacterium]